MTYSTIISFVCALFLSIHFLQAQTKISPVTGQNSYDRLLETQKKFDKAIASGDTQEIAEQGYILAKRHINVGNHSKAQDLLLKSLRIHERTGLPSESIGKIYLRLGEIQIIQNQRKEAEKYVRSAIYNFQKVSSTAGLTGGYRILGDIKQLAWTGDAGADIKWALDSANYYYKKSLQLASLLPTQIDMAVTYQCLGRVAELKNDISKSLWYKQEALKIYHQENLTNNITDLSTQIALDLLRRGQINEAKNWLNKARSNAGKTSTAHKGIVVSLDEAFAAFYEQTGDWKNALMYQKKAHKLKLSQFEQYQSEAIQNINLIHENETKTAELISHRKEEALQRKNMLIQKNLTIWISVLLFAACFTGVLFYLLFIKYRKISIQNSQLVKEQNHRTKNNLQSVSDLLSLQLYNLSDPHAVIAMEESLLRVEAMTLVHRSLYMEDNLVEVNLQKYLPDLITGVLQSYRLNTVNMVCNIDEIWIHSEKAITLGLIANELTTNACKYAFKNHVNPCLMIDCTYHSGKIVFCLQDNGPGFIMSRKKTSFGLGLIEMLTDQLGGISRFSSVSGCSFNLTFCTSENRSKNSKSKNQLA